MANTGVSSAASASASVSGEIGGVGTLTSNPRRRALFSSVAAVCIESGFNGADRTALETLTEMMQSCISELGRSSRAFAELSCRTEPLVGDVIMALIEMGINVESLIAYTKTSNRLSLPTPSNAVAPNTPKILQAGVKHAHPGYIADHYPSFPDPHAYIRTPTHKQPITEYYAIREKVASQKRDVERALTRFVAKTGDTQLLFNDETNLFPLIACKCLPHAYLSALMPKDQVFEEEEEEDSKELSLKMPTSETHSDQSGVEGGGGVGSGDGGICALKIKEEAIQAEAIDNPYLMSIKSPANKKRK